MFPSHYYSEGDILDLVCHHLSDGKVIGRLTLSWESAHRNGISYALFRYLEGEGRGWTHSTVKRMWHYFSRNGG